MIQIGKVCKEEGNESWIKIPGIHLGLNSRYETSRRNNPFVIILCIDDKQGLDTFPYSINKYQPTTEYHNIPSQALTSAKAS